MHRKKGPRRPEGGSARVRECLPLRFSGSISVATVLVAVMVTVLMLVAVMVAMLMLVVAITIKSHGAMPSRGHVSPF
jgi:uncharacterized membrane protein